MEDETASLDAIQSSLEALPPTSRDSLLGMGSLALDVDGRVECGGWQCHEPSDKWGIQRYLSSLPVNGDFLDWQKSEKLLTTTNSPPRSPHLTSQTRSLGIPDHAPDKIQAERQSEPMSRSPVLHR
jgi:hypothetical protein